jgi:hypothetical protein
MGWGLHAGAGRRARTLASLGMVVALTGCAAILGIDDGKPLPGDEQDAATDVSTVGNDATADSSGGADATNDVGAQGDSGWRDAGSLDAGSQDAGCTPNAPLACGAQTCGQQIDTTCGVWVSCGAPCPMDGGGNCTPDPQAACAGLCGGTMVEDQCSHVISCTGSCAAGTTCYQGACCLPHDPCAAGSCGKFDVCGSTVNCPCDAGGCTFQTCNPSTCTDNCGNVCCSGALDGGGFDVVPDAIEACLGSGSSCVPGGEACCQSTCTEFVFDDPLAPSAGPISSEAGSIYWSCP